ncbi:SDR family NAD(P)-dependent oxidoreductase [Shigella flexneri]
MLDLDSPESVDRAANEVIALTDNRLYGIFNNAGYGVYGPLPTISREQMEQQISANFWRTSAYHAPVPAMLPHGEGRIVMTSSVMGLISTPGRGAYAASKYALEAWSDALRMELRHSGIKVSLISPAPSVPALPKTSTRPRAMLPWKTPALPPVLRWDQKRSSLKSHVGSDKPKLRYPVTLVTWAVMLLNACCQAA